MPELLCQLLIVLILSTIIALTGQPLIALGFAGIGIPVTLILAVLEQPTDEDY